MNLPIEAENLYALDMLRKAIRSSTRLSPTA